MKKVIIIFVLVFCSLTQFVFATKEIVFYGDNLKTTYYCQVVQKSTSYIWDSNSVAYRATPYSWAFSALTLAEDTFLKGKYTANMPTSSPAGLYYVICRDNVTPVNTDSIVGGIDIDWDGTTVVNKYMLATPNDVNVQSQNALTKYAAAKTSQLLVAQDVNAQCQNALVKYTVAKTSQVIDVNSYIRSQILNPTYGLPAIKTAINDVNSTTADVASDILIDPNNKLFTDDKGRVLLRGPIKF